MKLTMKPARTNSENVTECMPQSYLSMDSVGSATSKTGGADERS